MDRNKLHQTFFKNGRMNLKVTDEERAAAKVRQDARLIAQYLQEQQWRAEEQSNGKAIPND